MKHVSQHSSLGVAFTMSFLAGFSVVLVHFV